MLFGQSRQSILQIGILKKWIKKSSCHKLRNETMSAQGVLTPYLILNS